MSSRNIAEELIRKSKSAYMDKETGVIVIRFDLSQGEVLLDATTTKGSIPNMDGHTAANLAWLLIEALVDSGQDFVTQKGWDIEKTEEGLCLTRRNS